MRVEVVFPTGERIEWGFADGNVPRVGDKLDVSGDPGSPRSLVLVQSVTWIVTERGCGEVVLLVS